jgi:hypothetical protein
VDHEDNDSGCGSVKSVHGDTVITCKGPCRGNVCTKGVAGAF